MSTGLLMLLDDIAATADDIAAMSKVAIKKTSGILGDDLALNAEQVSGMKSNRELPVVYKVFKGSLINKLILVPFALIISYFAPWLMIPLLMIGGAYLCYEGVENLYEKIFHKNNHTENRKKELEGDLVDYENKKVKGAIRTDFILSAEIVVVSLNALGETHFLNKVIALSFLALFFTFFVYGLVALIVRLDDIGFWFKKKKGYISEILGNGLINVVPYIMKTLAFVGLVAMFLVGGGIIVHGLPFMHGIVEKLGISNHLLTFTVDSLISFVVALIVGALLVGLHHLYENFKNKKAD
jgi:predicted DNA repair protein MutK